MISRKVNIIFLCLMLSFTIASTFSYAQNSIQTSKQKVKELEKDIKFLDEQIVATQQKHKNTLEGLVLIQNKVSSRKELLSELERQIREQAENMDSISLRINQLGQRLDTLEFYYKRLIRSAYKNRDSRTWFMHILASSSIEQGYQRVSYLKNYARSINQQAERIQQTRQERLTEKASLSQLQENTLKTQQIQEDEYQIFVREEQRSRIYAKALAGKQKEFRTQLIQKKQEADKLNKEVERMIAEAIRQEQIRQEKIRQEKLRQERLKQEELRKQKEQQATALINNKTVLPAKETSKEATDIPIKEAELDPNLSGNFAANKGKLPWPVTRGVIIESFGEHNHPTLPNVKLPFNNGINISAPINSPVKVVFNGIVKQIIAMPGYNQCILVQHGTFFTFYCKLDKVLVKVGDPLNTGDILGNLEDGSNTSVLHFELWNGTTKQNPAYWLKKQ